MHEKEQNMVVIEEVQLSPSETSRNFNSPQEETILDSDSEEVDMAPCKQSSDGTYDSILFQNSIYRKSVLNPSYKVHMTLLRERNDREFVDEINGVQVDDTNCGTSNFTSDSAESNVNILGGWTVLLWGFLVYGWIVGVCFMYERIIFMANAYW